MRRSKNRPDDTPNKRREIGMYGIAKVLGVNRVTVYRRIALRKFSLEDVPRRVTKHGTLYDMQAVFETVFPAADKNCIALMMYTFIQDNGGLCK